MSSPSESHKRLLGATWIDAFVDAISALFEALAKNTRLFAVSVGILLAVGLLAATLMNRREVTSGKARNDFFLAQKELESALKALAPAPVTPPAGSKATTPASPALPLFEKMDVNAKLGVPVKKLESVTVEYPKTRSAQEARILLGHLYMSHGEASHAVQWFEKAVDSASTPFEKAMALMALGSSHESAGQLKESQQAYERALNLGEASMKGDILLALGRTFEGLKDAAKARSTYDQIISQLPNTEHAKYAEIFKSKL